MFDGPMGLEPNISLGCLTFSASQPHGSSHETPSFDDVIPINSQDVMFPYISYYVFLGFNSSMPACLKWSFPPIPSPPAPLSKACAAVRYEAVGPCGVPEAVARAIQRFQFDVHGGAELLGHLKRWRKAEGKNTVGVGKSMKNPWRSMEIHGDPWRSMANIAKTHGCSWPSFTSSQLVQTIVEYGVDVAIRKSKKSVLNQGIGSFQILRHSHMMDPADMDPWCERVKQIWVLRGCKTILIYCGTPTNGLKSGNSSSKSSKPAWLTHVNPEILWHVKQTRPISTWQSQQHRIHHDPSPPQGTSAAGYPQRPVEYEPSANPRRCKKKFAPEISRDCEENINTTWYLTMNTCQKKSCAFRWIWIFPDTSRPWE